MHVLVIDDDRNYSHLLSTHLTRLGHDVTVADDGIQGQRLARLQRPDVITIDYHMPAANGLIVAQRLAASSDTQGIPIVMLTGSSIDDQLEDILAAGVTQVLSKVTLSEQELAEALAEAVASSENEEEQDRQHSMLFPGD